MPGRAQDVPQLPIERMGQLARRPVERERTERQAIAPAARLSATDTSRGSPNLPM